MKTVKTLRRALCAILCTALVLSMLTSLATDTMTCGGNGDEEVIITLSGAKIMIQGTPEQYLYICGMNADNSGAHTGFVYIDRNEAASSGFDISHAPDGVYYLQVYTSPTRYGTYYGYLYGDMVAIRKTGSSLEFVMPPVYDHNVEVFSSKRTDSDVLDYYLKPSRGIQSDDSQIIALAGKITNGLKSEREKLLAIYDWVAANIYYNFDAFYGRTPYGDTTALGTLESRTSVCQGYASLTAALLRAAGIPAKLVLGYALGIGTDGWTEQLLDNPSTTNHAWNEAFVDGRWIILDTTWDSDNKYEYGEFSGPQPVSHTYFDPSLEFFSGSHRIAPYSEMNIPGFSVKPTASTVIVNGTTMKFDAYNINGNNYFKLRDLAYALSGSNKQFDVAWDGAKMAINLISGRAYTAVGGEMTLGDGQIKYPSPSTAAVYKNGNRVGITAYTIEGNNFYKLRDILSLFDIGVIWDAQTSTIRIDTSIGYTPE